jgi:hypothetical protein
MAYKWDDKGSIIGDGLPDGVKIDVNQYQAVMKQYADSRPQFGMASLYPSMTGSGNTNTKLSDSITKFVYRDGKVQGFLPELEQAKTFNGYGNDYVPSTNRNRTGPISGNENTQTGFYVDVDGIAFDPATKSGDIPDGSEVSFSNDQGSTLATFKTGSQVNGYMRLATQQAKAADNLRLGNQSGTLDGSVRQNSQRRTLL